MKALRFSISIPGFLLARALAGITDAVTYGPLSGLSLVEAPPPPLPGARWVRVAVEACGICGSDLSALALTSSPALEPFNSFPAVMGHEIVGRVIELGDDVRGFEVGQRVAIDPLLACEVRGRADPCGACRLDAPHRCGRFGDPGDLEVGGAPLSAGMLLGYHRDLPGGFASEIVAHARQLHAIPDGLGDAAVLIEPLSVGLHAVLSAPPGERDPVLVIGSGPIAMATIWALRASGYEGHIAAQTKRPHEARLAAALGASETLAPDEAVAALARTGARTLRPIIGPAVYGGGGFPLIYECVGRRASLDQALRFAAPGGRIVLLGCAAEVRSLDLSFLWARELEVKGFVTYGLDRFRGALAHTFDHTARLLVERPSAAASLITHRFALEHYVDALRAAADHRTSGAMKVVLTP